MASYKVENIVDEVFTLETINTWYELYKIGDKKKFFMYRFFLTNGSATTGTFYLAIAHGAAGDKVILEKASLTQGVELAINEYEDSLFLPDDRVYVKTDTTIPVTPPGFPLRCVFSTKTTDSDRC